METQTDMTTQPNAGNENSLTTPGRFTVGCNYWASHAGTRMWTDWRPEVVAEDLRALHGVGMRMLRAFVLWPDFQPLNTHRTYLGKPKEMRHGEAPLPDTPCGQAGVDPVMLERLGIFLDLAHENGLRVLLGLITGWMSGRMFMPPALETLNPITDPQSILWQVRLVRVVVGSFRNHPAIAGWDLGNECNCMGKATRDEAAAWTAAIANAIRAEDRTHPVVSGMSGLKPEAEWTPQDQGEWTDILTVHPYPVFTPHCDHDPVNTIRTILHSSAESAFHSGIGGKPCLCQEIGTLGPMLASEKIAADFVRTCLFSLWAGGDRGLLWWCAHEQMHLAHTPYDWSAVERELGLLRGDRSPKPVAREIGAFGAFLDTLPFSALPERRREAVCILAENQDSWTIGYSSFILARQAGFELEFQHGSQPIRPAELYLLPGLHGHSLLPRRRMLELLERVEAGATLYMSLDDGLPAGFEALAGLEPQTRERRAGAATVRLDGLDGAPTVPAGPFRISYTATRAQVLGREEDGNPAFTVCPYGKGKIFFLSTPIEVILSRTPGAFQAPATAAGWKIYRTVAEAALAGRAVRKEHPMLAVTEHPLDDRERVVIAVNLSPMSLRETLRLQPGWALGRSFRGDMASGVLSLPANDAAVFTVLRHGSTEG